MEGDTRFSSLALWVQVTSCVSSSSHCYDDMPDKSNLKKEDRRLSWAPSLKVWSLTGGKARRESEAAGHGASVVK